MTTLTNNAAPSATNHTARNILIGLGAVVVVIVIFAIGVFAHLNGVYKDGNQMERQLNAQYQANQAELSSYISGFYELDGIAVQKTDALDKVLTDAVKGRYDGQTSAQPGTGTMFSAIQEAYPDLTANMAIYDKVADYVVAGRVKYKNEQVKLLDMLRAYETWMTDGFARSFETNLMGFPKNLEARNGKTSVKGQAALDQMHLIVTDSKTQDAYETGTLDPLTVTPKDTTK